jgi:hypothetical protein
MEKPFVGLNLFAENARAEKMTIEATILKNIKNLPESVKQAVLLYTEFLASQYSQSKIAQESEIVSRSIASESIQDAEKKYGYGSLAGKIIMSDDFDEPLEDLQEYM